MHRVHTVYNSRNEKRPRRWYFDLTAWTAALAVSGYPLVGLLSTYLGIEDNSISVPFRVFVFALAVAAFWQGKARAPLRAMDGWLFTFLLVYSFRLLWDTYIEEIPGADTALLVFAVTVLGPVIALALTARTWIDRNVALCFLTVGAVTSAGGIWMMQSGAIDMTYLEETGRLGFAKVNPISLGHVGTTTALASIALFGKTNSKLQKGALFAGAAIALAMVYYAASRGPVAALVASVAAYVLLGARWKYAMFGFVGIYAAIAVFSVVDIDALLEHLRLTHVAGENIDASVAERWVRYAEGFKAFEQNPIFGSSFNLPISGGWPHNLFLEAAMALGVGGLLLIVMLCLRSFFSSVRMIRSGNTMATFLFLQFVVAAQFSGSIWANPGLWIGVALLNAGRRKHDRGQRAFYARHKASNSPTTGPFGRAAASKIS